MTDVLLILALTPGEAKSQAKRRGIRAAFVGTVNGKVALLCGMEYYARIKEWWARGDNEGRATLLYTTRHDMLLDVAQEKRPLVAVASETKSPLHGVALNGRVAR